MISMPAAGDHVGSEPGEPMLPGTDAGRSLGTPRGTRPGGANRASLDALAELPEAPQHRPPPSTPPSRRKPIHKLQVIYGHHCRPADPQAA